MTTERRDRGIIGELTVSTADGGVAALIVTDGTWRVSETEETGWTTLGFDDSTWIDATVIANSGDPPWGAILTHTSAKWIWSAPVPVDTNDKPNLETAYARKAFYFSLSGDPVPSPDCPSVTDN